MFVQESDIQYFSKIAYIVRPDIGFSSVWSEDIIPLFPDPNGVRFNPAKVFQIFYAKILFNKFHSASTRRQIYII